MIEIRRFQLGEEKGLYALIEPVSKELVGIQIATKDLVEEWINGLEEGVWEIFIAVISKAAEEKEKDQKRLFPRIFKKKSWETTSNIIGFVTLFGDCAEDATLEEGEFEIGVTVANSFQNRGIGSKLVSFVLDRGKELGYNKASLWTRIDNHPMRKVSRKLGFVETSKKIENGFIWVKYSLPLAKWRMQESAKKPAGER